MIFKGFKILAIGVMTMLSSNVLAQDLLAKQAPIDRKMRGVDSIALQRLVVKENGAIPSASLYSSWNNSTVNPYSSIVLPEKFDIDLVGFVMPTDSRVVTSNFGQRWGRAHKGIDIKVYVGDTIRAAFDGMVRIVDYEGKGYGKYIVIRHDNGLETLYGHLSQQLVKINQPVKAGDVIGLGGNTGRSTGSHLHFETRLLGQAINPALLFDFPNQDIKTDVYKAGHHGYSTSNSYDTIRALNPVNCVVTTNYRAPRPSSYTLFNYLIEKSGGKVFRASENSPAVIAEFGNQGVSMLRLTSKDTVTTAVPWRTAVRSSLANSKH